MNKILVKKVYALIAIALLFLNLLFVGLGFYSHLVFWMVLAVIGGLSLFVIKVLLK